MKSIRFVGWVAGFAFLATACGSASSGGDEPSANTSQAICGNGVRPGCGPCAADPSSPTGASKSCFTCDEHYSQQCKLPPVLVPTIQSTFASPATIDAQQNSSTVSYSVSVPSGCVLEGSFSATRGGKPWINSVELDPPGNGQGWEAFPGLEATTQVTLTFWCRGYFATVSSSATITYQ